MSTGTIADGLFIYVLDKTDEYISSFVVDGFGEMQSAVSPMFGVLIAVYIVLYGYTCMYGKIETTLNAMFIHIAKAVLVWAIATNSAVYSFYVYNFLWHLPEATGSVVLRSVSGGVNGAPADVDSIGELFKQYQVSVGQVTHNIAKSGTLVPDMLAGILALFMFVPIISALFVALIAKVGLAVMLVIGPLMIIGLLFGVTKGLFEAWLRQAFTFILMAVLAYGVIALLTSMLTDFVNELLETDKGAIKWMNGIPLALLATVAGIVFKQVPQFAGGLANGVALNDAGVGESMRRGAGKGASKAGGSARRLGVYGAGKAGQATGQAIGAAGRGAAEYMKEARRRFRKGPVNTSLNKIKEMNRQNERKD